MQFHQATLPNGLQIIAEVNPSVHSVCAGYFVRAGSRDETADVSGVSHFLEHMAFKGDEKFSADDVNRIFDEVGAKYNASTSEEVTLFYAAVLPEYLPRTFEVLSALMKPSLRTEDFDMEKNVILEEIGMYDDQPSFLAYDHVMQTHFRNHPLGNSILGSNESISALTAKQMQAYHRDRYRAGNLILAVAGKVEFDEILQLANEYAADIPAGTPPRDLPPVEPAVRGLWLKRENSFHQHVMQMGIAPPASDHRRYAADLLSVIVGDDSGSRLFWEIVDPGRAEAAELGYNEYDGAGTWMIYLSCLPDATVDNLIAIAAVLDRVNREGVTEQELEQARNKAASRIVLRGERPMGRLSSLGSNWTYRSEYQSIADDLTALRSVTVADIRDVLADFPLTLNTTVGVGPLDDPTS